MLRAAIGKIRRWLLQESEEPRRVPRTTEPEIVVYYWDGSPPEGRSLRDISEKGAYIYTSERWYPGTIVRVILQAFPGAAHEDATTAPAPSTCIPARVMRQCNDGVAVEFAFRDEKEEQTLLTFLSSIPPQPARTAPVEAFSPKQGQSLVEFVLIVPLVFLLAINAINFGGFLFAWITVANAARDGAQYMAMSSASPGTPTPATLTQITSLVTSDVSSLLNRSSIAVAICTNKTTSSNGCTTLSDPEAPAYTLATVDVTYTYVPFIPLFSFPRLGIAATLPSGTIHRKAVMRMLQ